MKKNNSFRQLFSSSRFRKILKVISFVLPILSCSVIGLSYSTDNSSLRDAIAIKISNVSKENDNSRAILNYRAFNKDSNVTRSIFNSIFPENFLYCTQCLTVSSEESLLPKAFSISNDYFSSSISIIDGCSYTNQKSLLRFETMCINIYQYRERSVETNTYGLDGFIYLPDYLAEEIIKSSNGRLNYYEDLFSDGPTPDTLTDLLNIKVASGDSIKTFKIANIFHVDGYKKEYMKQPEKADDHIINDYNKGAEMRKYLGAFVVAYSHDFIKENNFSIFVSMDPKPYAIVDYTTRLTAGDGTVKGMFYTYKNGSMLDVALSNLFFSALNQVNSKSVGMIVFSVFSWIIVAFSILTLGFCFHLVKEKKYRFFYFLFHFSLLIVTHLFLTVLSAILVRYTYLFSAFYSKFFGIASLIFLCSIIFSFFFLKEKGGEQYD
ncbi:MAG: DUF2304 domain-containing protein [Bacilli bacterium]|nr:DUF2304 domain-containing protein [Bacilli bacterium]